MATRSRIAVELEKGKVISVYCDRDGYVKGVGESLMEKFPNGTDPKKVEEYVKRGDRATTWLDLKEWRGEDRPPQEHKSVSEFFEIIEEYGYLYTAEGEWLANKQCCRCKPDPVPLAYALSGIVKL